MQLFHEILHSQEGVIYVQFNHLKILKEKIAFDALNWDGVNITQQATLNIHLCIVGLLALAAMRKNYRYLRGHNMPIRC